MSWDEYPQTLGARLRWHRECAELTLGGLEVASEGRFRAATVGSWERGDRAVSVERLHGLAAFYGVGTWAMLPEWPPSGSVRLTDGLEAQSTPHGVTPGALRASEGSTAGGQEAA